jgi:hypothetical protein
MISAAEVAPAFPATSRTASPVAMNKIDFSVPWAPRVLGREKLGNGRWGYAIEAPFDMPAHGPGLMGMRVCLDNGEFEIRGLVAKMPPTPIVAGELIELLVVALTFEG